MSPRADTERLGDIQDAIESLRRFRQYLESSDALVVQMAIDAIKYHLIVVGEAAGSLGDATRSQARDVPWTRIKGLRNLLAHRYFQIDHVVIVEVIDGDDLTRLEAATSALLRSSE